jgi:ferrous iron transport protein B
VKSYETGINDVEKIFDGKLAENKLSKTKLRVALAGNPNSGKTTIFNALTGARQHVGNYPGVTVEKKEGVCKYKGSDIQIIDLPGTYSLTAYSLEEVVARDYIVTEHPDVVVNVIDASNLERNLYLTTQLMELDVPLVLVFNMSDVARQQGLVFDIPTLSKLLDAEIVQTVGSKEKGIDELLEAVLSVVEAGEKERQYPLHYGREIEEELVKIEAVISESNPLAARYSRKWLALKLLEKDKQVAEHCKEEKVQQAVSASIEHLEKIFGDEPSVVIADRRYGFISGACAETVKSTLEHRRTVSDVVDTVVLNPVLGLPIFAAMMYLVFKVTFWLGEPMMGGIEWCLGLLKSLIYAGWPEGHLVAVRSLLVDGVIGGVGGVVVFLPNIMLLFAAIAILEDSGYMSRAAFIMDRIMHKMGLHGKSFIPMIIGFGCSVPAIMATRILENKRNRLTTMMVLPLMSCGARITIYSLFIPAFFPPAMRGPVMWLIYFIGIALAVILAKVLRKTLFKGETVPFVMELVPYRMPTFKGISIHMWERGKMYLKKAGTVILLISIILWFLVSYPKPAAERFADMSEADAGRVKLEYSVAGRIGKAIEPAIKPLGFDYRIGTALIGAAAAKEVFVAQMGIVFSLQERESTDELRAKLAEAYSPLQGFCVMLFCLIAAPCVATVAVCWKESASWKLAALQFFGLTALGYVVTLVVYQAGTLMGF